MKRRTFLMTPVAAAAAPFRAGGTAVDFRYAPLSWQTAFCFPDDRFKSLVGERGELRVGHPGRGKGIDFFTAIVEFDLGGMERSRVAWQRLEAPGVPIVHTRLDRPEAFLELTTFATRDPGEGRVDNVLVEAAPRSGSALHAVPRVRMAARHEVTVDGTRAMLGGKPFLVSSHPLRLADEGHGYSIALPDTARSFLRFPQEGQTVEAARPERLLEGARSFWRGFSPFQKPAEWKLPGVYGEFAEACARNILQAREKVEGRLTFQVGPTVYRGLWVVDGHFILEAARYMGFDAEAQQGLETTWSRQEADGSIFAGAGRQHWKDTGIAMFSLVRQAELAQDWSYFRRLAPEVLRGVQYLDGLRDLARREGSANGRYGLLARGMGDGGLGGVRSEFTNTLWALAGLEAVARAAARLGDARFEPAARLARELRQALVNAARQEMRRHPAGFDYLPMLLKEDPQWEAAGEWERPRPQVAQWALSHAIYPGLVFEPSDPVVKGHVALMQACTREDIPAETGWLPHEGAWNYNAAFAAHAYLWAGEAAWARRTFLGFLNHATPLYCWREEQPLRGSVYANYVGDMPHNWASAECLLFLRHMLALEDGGSLRLLEGIGEDDLAAGDATRLAGSPTRFGRLDMELEPSGKNGWALRFRRGDGPAPQALTVAAAFGGRRFARVEGAAARDDGRVVRIDPEARSFVVSWA